MVKQKTHSGASKRFKKNKNGVVTSARPFRRKFLTKKSSRRKRLLCTDLHLAAADAKRIRLVI